MGASVQLIRWEKTSPRRKSCGWKPPNGAESSTPRCTEGRGQPFGEKEMFLSSAHSFISSVLPEYPPCSMGRLGRAAGTTQTPPPTPSHSVALTSHWWRLVLVEVLRGGTISEKVKKEDLGSDLGRACKRGRLFVMAAVE